MPSLPNLNFVAAINEMMRQYHTIELKLKTGEVATEGLQRDVTAIRADVSDLTRSDC